jgi:hypothetical protein
MKYIAATLLCSLSVFTLRSQQQDFYDPSTIQTIEIFFGFPDWDAQLDALASTTEDYLIADSVRINGVVFDSAGVKYKGNSSYNPNNNKNPIHIELNYVHGSYDYQGYTDIKLQNGYQDPSMIREVLSYAVLEQYMDCPKANFANVYINGTLRGLYSNAESINKQFNANHYFSLDGSFFKCNPVGGAGPGGGISPDLKWINSDTVSYYNGYELKSTYGWTNLVNFINTLNNNFSQIETVLDVDRAIWMLAFNNVLVNLDSYSGAFRQNYYLYRDLNDRFVPTVWDLNMSFAGFPGGTGSGPYTPTSLDPFSNSTSANHPLIVKFLANPMYKRMYMAHLRTIVKEAFESGWYLNKANSLRLTIDAAVQADPFKFFTYTQYQNSLTTAVTGPGPGGGSSIPGIQSLMNGRVAFFNTNTNYTLAAPTIPTIASSSVNPPYGQTFTINATCTNETTVLLGYRFEHALKFTKIQMFDDGQHQDGAAGDHVYGAQLSMDGYKIEYYVYAENAQAGLFSPQRAEHEFYTLYAQLPSATSGSVIINELMADNSFTAFDVNGESNDWIELLNTTGSPLNLTGLYLSDDLANLGKWPFPEGSGIQPGEHLIVWADQDSLQYGLHANFKLGSTGETLFLTNGTVTFDQIAFPSLAQDQSYARCPDEGTFTFTTPTFAAANNCYLNTPSISVHSTIIFPVPADELLSIRTDLKGLKRIQIVDMGGKKLLETAFGGDESSISIQTLESGCYLLNIQTHEGQIKTLSFVKM